MFGPFADPKSSAERSPILPSYLVLDTRELDEAIEFTRRGLGELRASPITEASKFRTQAHYAVLSEASIVYIVSHARLIVESPSSEDFLVFIGLEGRMKHSLGRKIFYSSPGRATIHSPGSEFRLVTEPSRHLIVRLPGKAVLREAASRFDCGVSSLRFEPDMDLTSGAGSAFERLVMFVVYELEQQGGLMPGSRPLKQIEKSLVALLLDAQPHSVNGNGVIRADAGPGVVRRVDELIRSQLQEPLTAGELARFAGVSARTLFRTYRRYRGRSPIQTLREVRLERVRRELLKPKPGITVTQAAIECGFTHLGRFSETYKKAFGEVPSTTLRRSRSSGRDRYGKGNGRERMAESAKAMQRGRAESADA